LQCSFANAHTGTTYPGAANRSGIDTLNRAFEAEPGSVHGEIGGTLRPVPNVSTRYADTLTGLKLQFVAVECHAT
jgi:hypothetical protein